MHLLAILASSLVAIPCGAVLAYGYVVATLGFIGALVQQRTPVEFQPGWDTNLAYDYPKARGVIADWF